MTEKDISTILEEDDNPIGVVGSPSSSFEAIIDIKEVSEHGKLLGELVCFEVLEGDNIVLVLGQITEVETRNRWHEEPSFKGIIKRHGSLPNLSGVADNRIAKINVQSSFILTDKQSKAHKLANSPSTGTPAKTVSNEVMEKLMKQYENELVCLGTAYDTNVSVPFWFKHFGSPTKKGAGEAYHIGIFGRTGSGKTTAAANMILGYARNKENISILILDPQEQFYEDNNVLPGGKKFKDEVKRKGMNYEKFKVPEEIALPNDAKLFAELLLHYGFIRTAFQIPTQEKQVLMAEQIENYIKRRMEKSYFKFGNEESDKFLKQIGSYFSKSCKVDYLKNVYALDGRIKELQKRFENLATGEIDTEVRNKWNEVHNLFQNRGKKKLIEVVNSVICNPGNLFVLNISGRRAKSGESLQLIFIKLIEDAIKNKGAELFAEGEQSNCLVVMDEAHRFINTYEHSEEHKELTNSIIDAVRTTRKYGIGYMFITQTIDSLHEEIRRQIRIFAFGYGLTSGSEFRKIRDIINDEMGAKFYRSFIDPSSNQKYPFMFYGPISPLSFTGAPLFLEMDRGIKPFPQRMK